jgi:hypothetical protein
VEELGVHQHASGRHGRDVSTAEELAVPAGVAIVLGRPQVGPAVRVPHRSRDADEQARVADPARGTEEQGPHDPNIATRCETNHMFKPTNIDRFDIRVEEEIVREV